MSDPSNNIEVGGWAWKRPSLRAFVKNVWQLDLMPLMRRSKLAMCLMIVLPILLLVGAYGYRNTYQPFALMLRIYADAIVAVILVFGVSWYAVQRATKGKPRLQFLRYVAGVAGVMSFALVAAYGGQMYQYVGQFHQYGTLDLHELDRMPVTDPVHERVLDLNSVHTLARWRRELTEHVSIPNFIRTKNGHCWSMAVEPDRWWQQWNDPIDEILCIPGTHATPNLTRRGLIKVRFEIGENLLFSRNSYSCARRSLGPLRFFSYEPGRPVYLQDDSGEWVQVVPWVRWTGTFFFLFPRPVFGGVQVIRQSEAHSMLRRWFWEAPKRVFTGCGQWVSSRDVQKYAYLRGQNLMPDTVSRSMAESFRFQEGLTAPWQIFRGGDVRIADTPDDVNRQPFISFYRMPNALRGGDKLYDAFALEPNDDRRKVLDTSLFIPSDGIGPSYVYRHSRKGEAPLGVTAVPINVRANRPDFFWSDRKPVEHRYFVRDLADAAGTIKRRIMYLTTVVLVDDKKVEDGKRREFAPGSIPYLAITDADTGDVEWVDPRTPEQWEEKVRSKFGQEWARKR